MEYFLVEHFKQLFNQDNNFTNLIYNPPYQNLKGVSKLGLDETHAPIIHSHFKEDIKQKEIHPRIIKLLKYKSGSYASIHTDEPVKGEPFTWTSITLIDKSDDLLGGENLLDGITKSLDIGETVWYPAGMPHGVNKLYQGYRNVLVILWTSIYLTE